MTLKPIRKLLLTRSPLPPLRPARVFRDDLVAAIDALSVSPLSKAGLHLLNDDIESCHKIVQVHETPDGNYWHAILHRREGDFENSLYWYRRVGKHPVLARMREAFSDWTPATFVRSCEEAGEQGDLQEKQLREMRLLLEAVSATV